MPIPLEITHAQRLADIARLEDDGCLGLGYGVYADPEYVCLIATDLNPRRLAVLHALLDDWYPLESESESECPA